jgi:hypothetical protein
VDAPINPHSSLANDSYAHLYKRYKSAGNRLAFLEIQLQQTVPEDYDALTQVQDIETSIKRVDTKDHHSPK